MTSASNPPRFQAAAVAGRRRYRLRRDPADPGGASMGVAILLIGTRKGLMIARSSDDRRTWAVDDFQFLNQEVYSVAAPPRHGPPRIFAGVGTGHWGPLLTYSDDLGKSWTEHEEPPIGFPQGSDA